MAKNRGKILTQVSAGASMQESPLHEVEDWKVKTVKMPPSWTVDYKNHRKQHPEFPSFEQYIREAITNKMKADGILNQ